jgi:hypothetical protein
MKMKMKAMLLATVLILGSVITSVALVLPGATNAMGGGNNNKVVRIPMAPLQCSNPGGQQDVAKEPVITNTTSKTLPKGQKIFWKSSDGDKGSVTLDAPLAPGKTVVDRGHAGPQSYTCTASTAISLL